MIETPTQFAQVGDMFRLVVQFVDPNTNLFIDLAGASSITVKFLQPDETTLDKTGALLTDGSDGSIYYDVQHADLAQIGQYRIQGEVTVGGQIFSTRDNPDATDNILEVFGNVDNS